MLKIFNNFLSENDQILLKIKVKNDLLPSKKDLIFETI